MQVEEFKKVSLGGFVALKSKGEEFLEPPAIGRVHPTVHGRALAVERRSSLNLALMKETSNLQHTVGRDLPSLVPTSIVGVALEFRFFLRVWRIVEASLSLVDSPLNIRRIISAFLMRLSR
ncbi:hypothetical protein M9H77_22908 [Catharanthus roseus]|uniref:Uncharacterized protein n=1 Tax=Catharanthus roseus TaxID=4058 RepID=A0ACC0ATB0_CATRO|nr:hypothetical protein M9H77_22908 [Catharanthus roseus]